MVAALGTEKYFDLLYKKVYNILNTKNIIKEESI